MGLLADRLGGTRGMRYAALVSSTASAGVALLAQHWVVIAAFLGLSGLANALAQPAANRFVAAAVLPSRQGIAFGVKQSAQPVAALLAGLTVPIIALTLGWRWSYAAAAMAGVLVALAIPRVPRHPARRTSSEDLRRRPPVLWLGIGFGLATLAATPLAAFVVDNAVVAGFDVARAGLLLTSGSLVSICVRVGAGAIADRRTGGNIRTVAIMIFIGSLGYLLLASQQPVLMVTGVVIAFGAGWGFPGLFWLAVVRNSPHAPGAATGSLMRPDSSAGRSGLSGSACLPRTSPTRSPGSGPRGRHCCPHSPSWQAGESS